MTANLFGDVSTLDTGERKKVLRVGTVTGHSTGEKIRAHNGKAASDE